VVGSGQTASVGVGLHRGLRLVDGHLEDIEATVRTVGRLAWREGNRDRLKGHLASELDLDVVYFYCHAGLDDVDEVIRVQGADDPQEGRLAAANLAGTPFEHRPLVFVNGCRTVGFSAKTLSSFITTLVTDRNAGGLIGTEIDVWEQLATEVGREFLGRFLPVPGIGAGQALRETRLGLLAKGNPLGLAYTLYALAELQLRP